jgi:hypothetical protein
MLSPIEFTEMFLGFNTTILLLIPILFIVYYNIVNIESICSVIDRYENTIILKSAYNVLDYMDNIRHKTLLPIYNNYSGNKLEVIDIHE